MADFRDGRSLICRLSSLPDPSPVTTLLAKTVFTSGPAGSRTMTKRATLRKTDILRGYRSFTAVISGGSSFVVRPVRLFFITKPSERSGVTIGFTAARTVRGAVRRNRIKRLLREAYRGRNIDLQDHAKRKAVIVQAVLMYVGPSPAHANQVRLGDVQRSVEQLLERLANSLGGLA